MSKGICLIVLKEPLEMPIGLVMVSFWGLTSFVCVMLVLVKFFALISEFIKLNKIMLLI